MFTLNFTSSISISSEIGSEFTNSILSDNTSVQIYASLLVSSCL
jgi:hypothetical protein